MNAQAPLQDIVDPFVRGLGGELVSEIVGNESPISSADYLFQHHNVLAELKSLQEESFNESLREKLGERMAEWLRRSRIVVFGTTRIDSNRLTPDCQREMNDLIASHLQNNVVRKANRQIRSTKQSLQMPNAKGLLWVASDGNVDLPPNTVWLLLNRILQKKTDSGEPQYSNIHALAYFSPRMLVALPGSSQPAQFWLSGVRNNDDKELSAFLGELCEAWRRYLGALHGIEVKQVEGVLPPPAEFEFLGGRPRLPQIDIRGSSRSDPRKR